MAEPSKQTTDCPLASGMRAGAWPINAHSMRTDFRENSRFTYEFFAVLISEEFAVQRRHYLRKSRSKTVGTTVLKFSKDWIMPTGKVKFYREDSGYGLIEPDDGGKDVFVHVTSVADPSVEIFREDRRVRYVERVSQRSGNREAFDVVVL